MVSITLTQELITEKRNYINDIVDKVVGNGVIDNDRLPNSYKEEFLDKNIEKALEFSLVDGKVSEAEFLNKMALYAIEELDIGTPIWEFIAGAISLAGYKEELRKYRKGKLGYEFTFYELHKYLNEEGLDGSIFHPEKAVFNNYSKEELDEAGGWIDEEKDYEMKYLSVVSFMTSYSELNSDKVAVSLPLERYLTIALYLSQNKKDKMKYAKELYWHLTNKTISPATPIMANANTKSSQLSSCFIDVTDDNLEDIYGSNKDLASISKNGGGIGVYMGKVRSKGSSIQGVPGVSSGTLPWIKQLNNTAVSVDQLGLRPGAIAVYLDIWHKDLLTFLDLKLNNGDERLRAYDIFTALSIPDLFMEKLNARENWHLFDPYEVYLKMGFRLEDYYDEEKGKGSFRDKYQQCVENEDLSRITVPAIEISKRYMRSQLETGTPFMFWRDTVNRTNPNKHAGMIYSSNLCTEITQNMSATNQLKEVIEGDTIITYRAPGDMVVCNLFSINLPVVHKWDRLEEAVRISIHALDETIDLNNLPVRQAEITNNKYRSLGLGALGWDELRATLGMEWDSEETFEYVDKLHEKINYFAIKASNELSKEKGPYSLFEGSDWHTGEYFEIRGYMNDEKWVKLSEEVKKYGMRNAYLLAIAPNSTTSNILGTTASIDPVFAIEYTEEKSGYKINTVAPNINEETYKYYYDRAQQANQYASVKQNIARQKHIDQAISFNLYVPNTIHAKRILELQDMAWKGGIKTIYYTRSTALKTVDCEWCHA